MFPVLATGTATPYLVPVIAQVAELADALGSGPSGRNLVQVRFLSWAFPHKRLSTQRVLSLFLCLISVSVPGFVLSRRCFDGEFAQVCEGPELN